MIPADKKETKTISEKLAVFIPVWVQIIMCISASAAVIAPLAFQEFVASGVSTETPTAGVTLAPVPTDTPTALPTVAMTQLPCTMSGTCLPGVDWQNNCVSSIWRPYLAGESLPKPALCYNLTEWGLTADEGNQGSLVLAKNKSELSAHEYGIFTPWQNWRQVDFSVDAYRLDNSEIWVGFFEGDTVPSRGIVFVIQHGDMIDIREMPRGKELINNTHLKQAAGRYNVEIRIEKSELFVSVDGQGIISNYPVNFPIQNFFVGYRSLPVMNLDATIFNLKFKGIE